MTAYKTNISADRFRPGKLIKSILIVVCLMSLGACSLSSGAGSSLRSEAVATNHKTIAAPAPKQTAAIDVAASLSDAAPLVSEPSVPETDNAITMAEAPAVITADAAPAVENAVASFEDGVLNGQERESPGLINQELCTRGLTGNLVTARAGQSLMLMASAAAPAPPVTLADGVVPVRTEMAVAAEVAESAPSAGAASPPNLLVMAEKGVELKSKPDNLSLKAGMTETLLVSAYEQTGRPFVSGGHAPDTGFDAAGYTQWVFRQKGINLPQGAKRQAGSGLEVAKEELRPGDILVYRDPSVKNGGYHVGIYTGQGNFLHAAAKTGVVTETAAFGPQFLPYFIGGRRYYDDPQAAPLPDEQKMSAASSAVKIALSQLGPDDKLVKNTKKSTKPAQKAKKSKKK